MGWAALNPDFAARVSLEKIIVNNSDRIRQTIARELDLELGEVGPDLAYGTVPEWDSVAHMYLTTALEEDFGIEFADEELAAMTTVSKIEEIVCSRTAG